MAKKFVIIRHAKSSWSNIGQKDFDRPLNDRGLKNAPVMGKRLLSAGFSPDIVYSSTAQRTKETAAALLGAMNYAGPIDWQDALYHASVEKLEHTIATANPDHQTIFIIAHNPGLRQFLIEHGDKYVTDHFPTCAYAAFELSSDHWTDFYTAKKKLIRYDFPKNTDPII